MKAEIITPKFVKADISFYLEGAREERLKDLSLPQSPLRFENELLDFYNLKSKSASLPSNFILCAPNEDISTSPLYVKIKEALDFKVGSLLYYPFCTLNPEKILEFKGIMGYFSANNIPNYLTATDEFGEETLIEGHNPRNGKTITNPRFQRSLNALLA